ncbi:MAG: hypothetical protein HC923_02100 [Myxococcales bacterium]|nr:hypothetical protein [Myxococcales bacterium]
MSRRWTEAGADRVWFVSPALATILFFVAQLALTWWGSHPTPGVAGLTPQAPQAVRGERVSRTIRPRAPVSRPVPQTEDELILLLDQHTSIRFEARP